MKKAIIMAAMALAMCLVATAQTPNHIYSGLQGKNHIQGIAYDEAKGEMYMSFTTSFLKTDLQGNVLGSLVNITGHLGCMTLNPTDGKVYASIEYKHDSIGAGIMKALDGKFTNDEADGFYIAIIDPSKITSVGQDAASAMTTVEIKEALKDFMGNSPQGREHIWGCSGIDGVTFAPAFGSKNLGKLYLYVAYGIYSDLDRSDNDCQVILCYDVAKWSRYETILEHEHLHRNGPAKPLKKYFVFTGNTSWGLQGLAYNATEDHILAAAYKGKKTQYPNYSLFAIDRSEKPRRSTIPGTKVKGLMLKLVDKGGLYDTESGVRGWNFKWGTTGMAPIPSEPGYWYISENGKVQTSDGKREFSNIWKYRWEPSSSTGFTR